MSNTSLKIMNLTKASAFFSTLLFSCLSHSNTITGSLLLESQVQVDALFGITEVTGDVTIRTNPDLEDPITNLDGLSDLQSVGGSLIVRDNDEPIDTSGLLKLTDVEGLQVFKNAALGDLIGLSNLAVCQMLLIYNNPSLTDYCGLYLLFEIQGNVWDFTLFDQNGVWHFVGFETVYDLIGDPCLIESEPVDPEALITELKKSEIIKGPIANNLLRKLRKGSIRAFENQINALVNSGILNEDQALALLDATPVNETSEKSTTGKRKDR